MEEKDLNDLNTLDECSRLKIVLDNEKENLNEGTRIGDKAPKFLAKTTMGDMKLSDYAGSWLILFSHPGDFTPVCTTEFIALAQLYPEFKKRNCNLLGLSIDSNPSHLAWVNNIYKSTGIQIPFPIIADLDMQISKKYNMIAPNSSNTQTVRCVFFIDPNQKIRAKLEYPMKNGRNIGELLRLLQAMQTTDSDNVATPANWIPGAPTILSSPNTYQELIERMNNQSNYNCMDWYLCFNKKDHNTFIPKPMTHQINNQNYLTKNYQQLNQKNDSLIDIKYKTEDNNCCMEEKCCNKNPNMTNKICCMRDDI